MISESESEVAIRDAAWRRCSITTRGSSPIRDNPQSALERLSICSSFDHVKLKIKLIKSDIKE